MAGKNSIQFLRGNNNTSSQLLLPGQPYYDYTHNKLYVGGKNGTTINNAHAIGSEVTSVNGKTGNVYVTKNDVDLGNVDNVKQYSASNPPPSVWESAEKGPLDMFNNNSFKKTFDSHYRAIFVTVIDSTLQDQTWSEQDKVVINVSIGTYKFTKEFKKGLINSFGFCILTTPLFSSSSDFISGASANVSSVFILRKGDSASSVIIEATHITESTGGLTIEVKRDETINYPQNSEIYVKYDALRYL